MIWKVSFCFKKRHWGPKKPKMLLLGAECCRTLEKIPCDGKWPPLESLFVPPKTARKVCCSAKMRTGLMQFDCCTTWDALTYHIFLSIRPSLGILEFRLFFCQTSWYVAQTVHVCVIRDLQHAIQEWQGCTVSGTGTTHGRCYRKFKTWCILWRSMTCAGNASLNVGQGIDDQSSLLWQLLAESTVTPWILQPWYLSQYCNHDGFIANMSQYCQLHILQFQYHETIGKGAQLFNSTFLRLARDFHLLSRTAFSSCLGFSTSSSEVGLKRRQLQEEADWHSGAICPETQCFSA